ncbi:MAG: SPOR domain-containing protein [Novosphingobium sp.]
MAGPDDMRDNALSPDQKGEQPDYDAGNDTGEAWPDDPAGDAVPVDPQDDGRLPLDASLQDASLQDDGAASLPWLESGDEDDEDEGGSARLIGVMVVGLVALAAIIGAIWWVSNRSGEGELVADGSTIRAPEEPYKHAPENPGGKTFAGTGDVAYVVSEGQTRPARLGQQPGTPVKPAAPTAAATPGVVAEPEDTSGVGVQIGAYSTKATAEAGWQRLKVNDALSGVRHRVVEGRADIGTVYRLQAVAADAAAAQALCNRLKASGIACQVKN